MSQKDKKNIKVVASNYIFPWLKLLNSKGVNIEPWLRDANISWSDLNSRKFQLVGEQYFQLVTQMLTHYGEQNLIELVINHLQPRDHGLLGLLALSGTRLRPTIKSTLRFYPLRAHILDLTYIETKTHGIIRATPVYDLKHLESFIVETGLRAIVKAKHQLFGPRSYRDKVQFTFSKPCEHEIYRHQGRESYHFDQEYNQIVFPKSHLELKCQHANKALYDFLEHQCEEALAVIEGTAEIEQKIRYILKNTDGKFPSLTQMACMLDMSTRTLRRHLQQLDLNYQALLDEERINQIKEFLSETDMTMVDIASTLHFSDASYMTRFFAKQTDMSPSEYRETTRW